MGAGEEGVPVDGQTRGVQGGEGGHGCPRFVVVLAEGRYEQQSLVVRHAGAGEGGESGVRADLDETGDALLRQGGHTVGETDGLADVADPVVGVVNSPSAARRPVTSETTGMAGAA